MSSNEIQTIIMLCLVSALGFFTLVAAILWTVKKLKEDIKDE